MKSLASLFDLRSKTALVTGASSGLGVHFAKVLASQGASVVVGARRIEKLADLVADIEANGGRAVAVALDVTNEDSVEQAFTLAEKTFGIVDILVNNAGVEDSRYFLDVDEASWDLVMETNLKGSWRMARRVCQGLVAAEMPGCIVNIASLLGMSAQVKQSAYAVSKAGLIHLTRSMALEMGRYGIRINGLAPGYFKSEMTDGYFVNEISRRYLKSTPSGRLGEVEDLTGPLMLLCSDAGAYLNGAVIPVDGGHLVALF